MSGHKRRLFESCAISTLAIAWTVPLHAQTAPDANPQTRNTQGSNVVVVTARRLEESVQDVPVAITAFTAEDIRQRSINELEDVALLTPGLVFEDYSNGGFGTPTIRGATQFAITSLEQNVSVFLDGIYIPRQYAFDIGAMNLERIEVVKGPQSALYGANAFAGAINYVSTNRSLNQLSASGAIEVSENGGFDLSGKISAPLVADIASVRAGVGISKFGGDWENNFPGANTVDISPGTKGNLGGYENSALTVGASVRPIEALTIDVDYYNFDVSSETRAQYRLSRNSGDFNCSLGGPFGGSSPQLFCGELSVNPVAPPGSVDFPEGYVIDPRSYGLESESDILRVNIAAELTDNVSANYLFGRSTGDVFSAGQSDRNPITGTLNFGSMTEFSSNFSITPVGSYSYDSHEFRLQYQGDTGFLVMVGGFIQDGEDRDLGSGGGVPTPSQPGGQNPITSLPATARPFDAFTETDIKAVFGRVSVPLFNERMAIELEGRYTDETKELTDLSANSPYVFDDTYFTPRANILYNLTDDNLLYASVAKGIKSGGINNNAIIAAERFYGPDANWTYEIGVKNTFMNGLATLNLAAFYIDWSNLQLSVAPTGGTSTTPTIIQNVGGATIKGLEVDGSFEVFEGLVVNGGLAYIDATYNDGVISGRILRGNVCGRATAPSDVCNFDGDIGGNELQRTSKVQWNAGVSYDAAITDRMDFFTRFDVAGQSKQFVSEINVTTIEPRTLVNGRLGIRNDNWSLSVWGKNLFDKKYVSNAFFIASPFFADYVPTAGNRRRLGATITFDY